MHSLIIILIYLVLEINREKLYFWFYYWFSDSQLGFKTADLNASFKTFGLQFGFNIWF